MTVRHRKQLIWRLACSVMILMAVVLSAANVPSAKAADTGLDLQCIADQEDTVPGGEVSLHLIYHNVTNKIMTKSWLKLQVDEAFDVNAIQDAEWDATARTLTWKLADLDSNGAGVVNVNLKVKADTKLGESIDAVCTAGGIDWTAGVPAKVEIKLGTATHQPVFDGYPDGKFHPERNLTRAETAAMVSRIKQLKEESTTTFADVPKEYWAYSYIQKVSKVGYMVGSDGSFHPDDPITRAEFVTLMLRLRGIHPVPLQGFPDTKVHWSNDDVATAKSLNFIDGVDDLDFVPDAPIERRYAAKLMDIALFRGPLQDGETQVVQHWPDVSEQDPEFGWIEEASLVAHESKHQNLTGENLIRYLPDQTNPF